MKPTPPKSTRVHGSPSSELNQPTLNPPTKSDSSQGGPQTGGSDLPTEPRTMGEHLIRLDEADAPTVVPASRSADDSEPATDANADPNASLLTFGDHPSVSMQSPAMWLGALGYRIDRLLGRGGYGEVYLADHPKLPRQVAIKVPRADVMLTAEFKRRFLDEANIVAQMDHPNVVTIYDMIANPYPAIIYEYCGDGTLQNLQPADGTLLDEATAIKLFELVADALAFAHNRGVLHRDIKPSNILIQAAKNDGDAHSFFFEGRWWTPKLADFGLAKVYGDGHTETATGMVAGTPEYMSPEQAIGRSRDIGTFSDTFSLGVVIYRTLIGHVPFPATSRLSSILKIENGDYAIPRRVRRELSADIEAVIVKSLRPLPSDRYRDATELLGDLRRLSKGQPVEARPYTWRDRFAQKVRRNPVASVSAMFVLLGLMVFITMIWRTSKQQKDVIAKLEFANSKLAASITRAESSEQAEIRQRVLSEKFRYAAEMRLCQESFIKGDIRGYQALLQNHVPKQGQQDHRGFSWYWLWEQGHAEPYRIDLMPSAAYCVVFSPDEKWLAACGADGAVRVYSTSDWSIQRVFYTDQGEVNGLSFSSNGASIVSAGDDGTAKIWDWHHGELKTSIKCHTEIAYSAKFINHDTQLITCGNERPIRVWNLGNSNSLVGELIAHTDSVDSFHIAENEKYLVSAGADGARIVWDLESLQPVSIKQPLRSQRVLDAAVLSAAKQVRFLSASLAGNSGENALLMLETSDSDHRRALLTSSSGFQTICTTNQGNLVAVGDRDGGVTLLDISDMLLDTSSPDTVASIIGRWTGHQGRVYSSAFSPSGKHLVTCGDDGNVYRWEPSANQRAEYASMDEVEGATENEGWTAFDYADQTQQVFVVSNAPAIDRWDVRSNEIKRICHFEPGGRNENILVNDIGTRIFLSDNFGNIQRFDVDPDKGTAAQIWQVQSELDSRPKGCNLAVSSDGSILACAYSRNRNCLALYDAETGELLAKHSPQDWLSTDSFGVAISPASSRESYGRVAYALGGDAVVLDWVTDNNSKGTIRIVNEQILASESDTVLRLCFQDHKTLLATTARNQLIKWELGDQWQRELFSGQPKPLKNVRPLPDGREVWTASGRDTIMTWCLHTSHSLIELPIIDVGPQGNVQVVGREVTGNINNRTLFWQPLLTRWPAELDVAWSK